MITSSLLGTIECSLGNITLGYYNLGPTNVLPETASNDLSLSQSVETNFKRTNNTLSFSQIVTLHLVCNAHPTSTFVPVGTANRNIVCNETVSSTLALTETLKRIRSFSASNTLALGSNASGNSSHVATNTLTLSQVIDSHRPYGRTVSQSLTLSGTATETEVRHPAVVQTVLLSHSVHLTFPRSVSHTLTLVQNASAIVCKLATNTITFTQSVVEQHYHYRRVFANLNLTQTLVANFTHNYSVTQTLSLTQTIKRILDVSASNTLSLSQFVAPVKTKNIVQTLALTQTLVGVRIFGRSPLSILSLTQVVSVQKIVNKRMFSLFVPRHTGRIVPIRNRSVTSTLVLTASAIRLPLVGTATNNLTFGQSVTLKHARNFTLTHNLTLSQVTSRVANVQRTLTNNLVFIHNKTKPITIGHLNEIIILDAQHTVLPKARVINSCDGAETDLMKISVPEQTVVLPPPLFGDGEGNTDQFTLSLATDGTTYTTVKKSGTRSLRYEWDLAYSKAEELSEFVWNYNSKAMRIENWKGEIWIVRMTTNPVTFSDLLLPEICESRSKVVVALEFEGVRIH